LQDNDNEDIIRESLSDMDPALLFAANHFVEELLVKAQEEARCRMTSENEVFITENKEDVYVDYLRISIQKARMESLWQDTDVSWNSYILTYFYELCSFIKIKDFDSKCSLCFVVLA